MRVRRIKGSEVDEDRWNALIAADSNRLVYGTTWYLDMIAPDWEALILEDYRAVWPVAVGQRWGQAYAYRPYGLQQLGVFSDKPLAADDWEAFFAAWPGHWRYADLFLNESNDPQTPDGWKQELWPNRVLNLNRSYETIYSGFNQQLRRNLRKAEGHNHRIFEHDSPEVLLTLFSENRGKEVKTWGERERARMRQLMYVLLHKRRGFLWTIHDEHNSAVAGAFFLESHGRLIFLFSATTPWARETGAMAHLLNELIILRSGSDLWLDFEGSAIPGLDRFYASFGAERRTYPRLIFNNLPFPFYHIKRLLS